jgi:putative thioredoxin
MFGFGSSNSDTHRFEMNDFGQDVEAASQTVPVVVDFWAPWCGPCRMLSPTLEKLADESEGTWKLVTVNTDNNQDLARRFEIRGIPTVKLFIEGQEVSEFVGVMPERNVRHWLADSLSRHAATSKDEA